MNIAIEIEYDGTEYAGWQIQPHRKTIQGELQRALSQVFQMPIKVIGASRTDAGVSALGQIANFKLTDKQTEDINYLKNSLNAILPNDIYIKRMKRVPDNFHARFSAKGKVYEYKILLSRAPLRQHFAWLVLYKLNISKMRRACRLFVKQKDFKSFCEADDDKDGRISIKSLQINKVRDEITIKIEANRFLYKMVRRIVGALVEIGRGHRTDQDIKDAFEGVKNRSLICAPAQGLKLVKVKY